MTTFPNYQCPLNLWVFPLLFIVTTVNVATLESFILAHILDKTGIIQKLNEFYLF
jgi:hypothetical protein